LCPFGICCARGYVRKLRKIDVSTFLINWDLAIVKKLECLNFDIILFKGSRFVDCLSTLCNLRIL
jgi:hypothetical protein